jgi:hypothetical protein
MFKIKSFDKTRFQLILKVLFLSKRGWLAIVIANVMWSMFWFPFLLAGFITGLESYYVIALSIYVFFAQPLIPMWLIIPLTSVVILKWMKPDAFRKYP